MLDGEGELMFTLFIWRKKKKRTAAFIIIMVRFSFAHLFFDWNSFASFGEKFWRNVAWVTMV